MVDSSSRSSNVFSLLRNETSIPIKPNYGSSDGGAGGGGDVEQRLSSLENQVKGIYQALTSIGESVESIERRTRALDKPLSPEKVLLWLAGAIGIVCAAYAFVTPLFIDAKINTKMEKIDNIISRVEQSVNKNDSVLEAVNRIEKAVINNGDAINQKKQKAIAE